MSMLVQYPANRQLVALRQAAGLLAAALAAALGLLAANASAQTATWTGGGSSTNWSDAGNWSGTAPVNSSSRTFVFDGSTGVSNTNNLTGVTITAGTFNTSGFTLGGNAVTLGGTLTNSAATGTNTINFNMALSGNRTISGVGGSTLELAGTISGTNFGLITSRSSGTTRPTFVLSGNNTMSGQTSLAANTRLVLGHANALGTGELRFRNDSFLDVNQALELSSPLLIDPNGNTATFQGTAALAFTGQVRVGQNNVTLAVSANTLTLKSLGNSGVTPGFFTKTGNGTLAITDAAQDGFTRTAMTLNGGILRLGNATALGTGALTLQSGTLQASSAITIANPLVASGGSVGGTSNFTLGGAISGSSGFTKLGTNTVTLSETSSYSGTTAVNAGTLLVDGSILNSLSVTVAADAWLGGSGRVTAISGAGRVSPGNSPGILTATSAALGSGLDFAFEFNQAGSPNWGSSTASGNDVLRLTGGSPISGTAGLGNVFDIYFAATGQTYRGGLFTDLNSSFESAISGATFNYFVRNEATGTVTFNGLKYSPLDAADVTRSTVQVASAAFAGGAVSGGYTMEFVVVPEPTAITLVVAAQAAALGLRLWRRRPA